MNDSSEWLAVMLEEIERKRRERREALEEAERRGAAEKGSDSNRPAVCDHSDVAARNPRD